MHRVITNNVPRDVVEAYELSAAERKEFDYIDWEKVDRLEESPSFFRYKGQLHDLGEFTANWGLSRDSRLPESLAGWDGYRSDSAFSALVVKYIGTDCEQVVIGLVLS